MSTSSTPPRKSFLRRRLWDPILAQLTQGTTPKKIALTFAIGSALGVFPILGSTTLLCLLVGVILKLNQPILQTVNQLLWPVQIPAIFMWLRAGEWLFRAPHVSLNLSRMLELFRDQPNVFFNEYGMSAVHGVVAWSLIAPFYVAAAYFSALPIVSKVARRRVSSATADPVQS